METSSAEKAAEYIFCGRVALWEGMVIARVLRELAFFLLYGNIFVFTVLRFRFNIKKTRTVRPYTVCGKKDPHQNSSTVKPEKAAPVISITLRIIILVPYRQTLGSERHRYATA